MRCAACSQEIDGPTVRMEYTGFESSALNGAVMLAHARCIRLVVPESEITLPERVNDPVADTDSVIVYLAAGEWLAFCRECKRTVAEKSVRDDADLAAARHMFRVHSGLVPV